jgi:Zn-dependent protease/CBS domain-containing protein
VTQDPGTHGRRGGLGAPARRNEPGTLRIGSISGVDVLVKTSWLFIAVLIAWLFAPRILEEAPELGNWAYVGGLAFAVLLTLSLLVHEASHALMAQRFGLGVESITLHFIGGVTAIEGEPRTPKQEALVSGIGPISSLAVGGAALALSVVTPDGLLRFVVSSLAVWNLVIGVLNLLPGIPLDGGRVLRALVWKVGGDPNRGTVVAGWAGRGVALLALFTPVILPALGFQPAPTDWLFALIVGWFLWSAASAAIVSGKLRARLPALQARRLARRTLTVPEDLPVAEAVRRARQVQAGSIVTVDQLGRPVGLVNETAVSATPEDRRPWVTVRAVSRTLEPGLTLPADSGGEELVRAMQRSPSSEYLLLEPDGSLYGVLVTQDVDAAFNAGLRAYRPRFGAA